MSESDPDRCTRKRRRGEEHSETLQLRSQNDSTRSRLDDKSGSGQTPQSHENKLFGSHIPSRTYTPRKNTSSTGHQAFSLALYLYHFPATTCLRATAAVTNGQDNSQHQHQYQHRWPMVYVLPVPQDPSKPPAANCNRQTSGSAHRTCSGRIAAITEC